MLYLRIDLYTKLQLIICVPTYIYTFRAVLTICGLSYTRYLTGGILLVIKSVKISLQLTDIVNRTSGHCSKNGIGYWYFI